MNKLRSLDAYQPDAVLSGGITCYARMIHDGGYLHFPEKPGLGCELDEQTLSRYEVNTVFIEDN